MALGLVALGFVASTANEGCIYDTSLLLPDAGPSAPAECAGDGGISATVPKPPLADDPSNLDLTVILAFQSIDVGVGVGPDGGLTTPDGGLIPPTDPQPHIGVNLDGKCTCCGDGPTCIEPPDAATNCDDSEGRDNTGIKLFRFLQASAQTGNQDVDQSMYNGLYGIVIQITGYNGQPNDHSVTVAIYASNGVLGPDGGVPTLHHDGTDPWTVDPRYVQNGIEGTNCGAVSNPCTPNYYDPYAYVSCGVLVSQPTVVPFTFGGRAAFGGTVMKLQEPYIVGNLVQTTLPGNTLGWSIANGSVTGRWESADLLSNMASIPDPTQDGGVFLCGQDPLYGFLKPFICGLQDITSNSAKDNMSLSCNSISMAFGFTAAQAVLGVVAPIPPTPAGCSMNGSPFSANCDSP